MTTLGVMTSAERGSFLFDTTSLMNSANLTTSTWSLHFNCYTEGRVRSLRYLLQFYLLVEMTFSKGLHCLSLMSVNLTWNFRKFVYIKGKDEGSMYWPSSWCMSRPEASCCTSWPSRELNGANFTLKRFSYILFCMKSISLLSVLVADTRPVDQHLDTAGSVRWG